MNFTILATNVALSHSIRISLVDLYDGHSAKNRIFLMLVSTNFLPSWILIYVALGTATTTLPNYLHVRKAKKLGFYSVNYEKSMAESRL